MERAQSSPPGGDGAERNFFRRNGGCIAPALKGLLTSPPVRASKGFPLRGRKSLPARKGEHNPPLLKGLSDFREN